MGASTVRTYDDDEEHGSHVPSRQSDATNVEWTPIHGSPQVARIIDATCECRATVYELCAAGGQRFVRRTTRGSGRPTVRESPRDVPKRADGLWQQIMTGAAR